MHTAGNVMDVCDVPVEKLPLDTACDDTDVCKDGNAHCTLGDRKCLCRDGFHNRNGQCGMFISDN